MAVISDSLAEPSLVYIYFFCSRTFAAIDVDFNQSTYQNLLALLQLDHLLRTAASFYGVCQTGTVAVEKNSNTPRDDDSSLPPPDLFRTTTIVHHDDRPKTCSSIQVTKIIDPIIHANEVGTKFRALNPKERTRLEARIRSYLQRTWKGFEHSMQQIVFHFDDPDRDYILPDIEGDFMMNYHPLPVEVGKPTSGFVSSSPKGSSQHFYPEGIDSRRSSDASSLSGWSFMRGKNENQEVSSRRDSVQTGLWFIALTMKNLASIMTVTALKGGSQSTSSVHTAITVTVMVSKIQARFPMNVTFLTTMPIADEPTFELRLEAHFKTHRREVWSEGSVKIKFKKGMQYWMPADASVAFAFDWDAQSIGKSGIGYVDAYEPDGIRDGFYKVDENLTEYDSDQGHVLDL
ncbi:hypothetical protein F5878DRAFT_710942 [Lentinula raphanica]|uniref:Uncharacterized protein n=1 Tax=Lentinula raphanica TaxID=153919 RepID=A0AA38P6J4_9AGAR|nr:hypothetical protein F5878DRAFT_710942 [Lentinula raphanica]